VDTATAAARLNNLLAALRRTAEGSPDPKAGGDPAPAIVVDPTSLIRAVPIGRLGQECGAATDAIFSRLADEDIAEIERQIQASPELSAIYSPSFGEPGRRHLLLSFGTFLGVSAIAEKAGLPAVSPPEDIHAMARGPLSAAGGVYEADMVADALASVGADPAAVRSGLDFGCSSGRVVRVLNAAYPQVRWHGCDPNGEAIRWASENLMDIDFFASADSPPLTLEDASLGLAVAISIWSHFEPHLGLSWFEEMHRLLRPGGLLVMTTHGLTSVAFYATRGLRTPEQSRQILDSLYRDGYWYASEFGEGGDWGVVNPSWGTAFLSLEWLLAQLCPRWRVLDYAPGRNQENQDVYVLERA
jgi:SAM-dependent methyltransferase